jgi:NAD+ kinase
MPSFSKFHFRAAETPVAQTAYRELITAYGQTTPDKADAIIVLGGDGTMLEALHSIATSPQPIYGMNRGSVGFLMNPYSASDLPERLSRAMNFPLHPLRMTAKTRDGTTQDGVAFNGCMIMLATVC